MRDRAIRVVASAAFITAAWAQTAPAAREIAASITANGLKADISFLASDAMKGRATPSPEQEIAAEYIAAQFRRAGLEPVGDDGYFQTAQFESVTPNSAELELTLSIGGRTIKVDRGAMQAGREAPTQLEAAAAVRVTSENYAALTADQVRGKVVLADTDRLSTNKMLTASLILMMPTAPARPARAGGNAMIREAGQPPATPAIILIRDEGVREALAAAPDAEVKVTARVGPSTATPVRLRNVVGLLRGSDPALKDTFLVISAHYDHLGVRAAGEGDRIFNGANDNASGSAAVVEMANAIAALPKRPKRSILFLALFGEEVGEFGSAYYTKHPLFPLAKTIADVNMEQLGRTDDTEGARLRQFNLTGFDYTNLAGAFSEAGKEFGVQAVKHEKNSDSFFGRSDNAAFSAAGVPSTTVSVTYVFPDYHAVGDEWPKIDYENMALVTRTLALGAFQVADSAEEPRWNDENPKTARYVKARQVQR